MNQKLILLLAATAVAVSGPAATASWCPFCDAPSQTLSEQLADSGNLLLGRWKGGERPTDEQAGTAVFEVLAVAKCSTEPEFKVGDTIELPQYVAGSEKALYALMGPGREFIDWHFPMELSKEAWDYLANVPPVETSPERQAARLRYFVKYLNHPDLLISNDAYAEFAIADYEIIKSIRDAVSGSEVREWLLDPQTPITRRGLFGLLVGISGDKEDARALEPMIRQADKSFRIGIEAVMSGYIMIMGEEGLEFIEEHKMKTRTYIDENGEEQKLKFSEIYASMQALRFLWTYEPDLLGKDRIRQSARLLLDNSEITDLIIADLSRWKDWTVQDRLMQMLNEEQYQVGAIRRAIVKYMYYCSKDRPKDSEEVPEHAAKAEANLELIRQKDPNLVQSAIGMLLQQP